VRYGSWAPAGSLAADVIRGRLTEEDLPWKNPDVLALAKSVGRFVWGFWHRRDYRAETVRSDTDLINLIRCAELARFDLTSSVGRTFPRRRLEVDLTLRLPADRHQAAKAALSLSGFYGVKSLRLRYCRRCRLPFAVPLNQPRRRTCGCQPEAKRFYVNWLGFRHPLRQRWVALRQRVATWAARKVITREEGTRLLSLAADDLGRLDPSEWTKKYGGTKGEGLCLREGRGVRVTNRDTILAFLAGATPHH